MAIGGTISVTANGVDIPGSPFPAAAQITPTWTAPVNNGTSPIQVTLMASYSGDGTNPPCSSSCIQTVNPGGVTDAITINNVPSVCGSGAQVQLIINLTVGS